MGNYMECPICDDAVMIVNDRERPTQLVCEKCGKWLPWYPEYSSYTHPDKAPKILPIP